MQYEASMDSSLRPQEVQFSNHLEAYVEAQAFPDLPAVNTPSDTTALLPPSPNSELPWLFEQSSRQPPTAKAEARQGQGAAAMHMAHSSCPLLHIPTTVDHRSANDAYGLCDW